MDSFDVRFSGGLLGAFTETAAEVLKTFLCYICIDSRNETFNIEWDLSRIEPVPGKYNIYILLISQLTCDIAIASATPGGAGSANSFNNS